MIPLRIALLALIAIGVATSLTMAVRWWGWRRGLLLTGERLLRVALVSLPWFVQVTAGTAASWCSLVLVVPAAWFGGTSLGIANFLVLQWFGVRLARVEVPGRMRVVARRAVRAGQLVTAADVDMSTAEPVRRWTLLRWVWPLTGWWSAYRWIARRP
jgi:hypothetical protein